MTSWNGWRPSLQYNEWQMRDLKGGRVCLFKQIAVLIDTLKRIQQLRTFRHTKWIYKAIWKNIQSNQKYRWWMPTSLLTFFYGILMEYLHDVLYFFSLDHKRSWENQLIRRINFHCKHNMHVMFCTFLVNHKHFWKLNPICFIQSMLWYYCKTAVIGSFYLYDLFDLGNIQKVNVKRNRPTSVNKYT